MSNETQFNYRWFLWTGLAVLTVAASIVLVTSWRSSPPKRVTVSVDTNGTARLGGVPLLGTNFRDAAFSVLGAVGVKGQLAVPPAFANKAQESNVIVTLKSMTRAGLFTTNQPPNPYE